MYEIVLSLALARLAGQCWHMFITASALDVGSVVLQVSDWVDATLPDVSPVKLANWHSESCHRGEHCN